MQMKRNDDQMMESDEEERENEGEMTVEEAGHMGGEKEKELVEKGHEVEGEMEDDEEDDGENIENNQ